MLTYVLYIWFLIKHLYSLMQLQYSDICLIQHKLEVILYQNKQVVRLPSAKKKEMVKWE